MSEDRRSTEGLDETGRACLAQLLACLPPSDRDNYPPALFAKFAAHAAMLRATVPWCAALEEDLFLHYVACHRVNDEDISFHLDEYHAQLYPRVQGMELAQAALEVNRWCHEQATYRQQDDRTASPWTVYKSGVGRCGEESAFVVAALRSVGIPARQVYAPRWSHCDDNHAWVEVFCKGQWRFMGACEPEPVLDKGWFNVAASRAVLVHSRKFAPQGSPAGPQDGAGLERRGPAQFYSQTARYAPVGLRRVCVLHKGAPVLNAAVQVEVLNEAVLYPVLTLCTGQDGMAEVELGLGDVYLEVRHPAKGWAEALFPAGEALCRLELQPQVAAGSWQHFDFLAPPGTRSAPALTKEQKQWRAEALARGAGLRQQCAAARAAEIQALPVGEEARRYLLAARGNFREILAFLQRENTPMRLALLGSLAEKDLLDTPAEVLEDHLRGAMPHAAKWPRELFTKAVLCPRIATERLTPWRGALAAAFPGEEGGRMREQPALLWERLCQNGLLEEYPNLFWAPEAALRAGRWDEKSRALLFVALLRSWGIPARLRPEDGAPCYWNGTAFVPPWEEASALLTLQNPAEYSLVYRKNWSLARHTGQGWQTLALQENWQGNAMALRLPLGRYRLLTSVRLPNGSQYAARCELTLERDMPICMQMRDYRLADVLPCYTLPEGWAQTRAGDAVCLPDILENAPGLLFWLLPGEEPTEHVLNELLEARQSLQEKAVRLVALLPFAQAAEQATFAKVAKAFPEMCVLLVDWEESMELYARSLYCDPDSPPLAVCSDGAGRAVYASSGYNVGLVELLLQILSSLPRGNPEDNSKTGKSVDIS